MAASADVIEMRAAIEQVLAELESIPSLKDEQKVEWSALEAFKRKFALHKQQRSCTDMLFTSLPRRSVITSYASLI